MKEQREQQVLSEIYVRAASPGGGAAGRAATVPAADGLKNYGCGACPQLPL